MSPEEFLKEFGHLAGTEGGISRLRGFIRELAATGRLGAAPYEAVSLGDVALDLKNGISKRAGKTGALTPVLRLADIKGGEISLESLREILLSDSEREQYAVEQGDILIIRVNGSADLVGAFIPCRGSEGLAYSDHLIRLRLDRRRADPRFICVVAASTRAREHIVGKTVSTAGQKTVNQKGLSSLLFQLPPLPEQKRIVEKVDQLMALCDDLEAKQTQERAKAVSFNRVALNAVVHAPDKSRLKSSWSRVQDHFEVLYELPENVEELRGVIRDLGYLGRLAGRPGREVGSDLVNQIFSDRKQNKVRLLEQGIKRRQLPPDEKQGPSGEIRLPAFPEHWDVVGIDDLLECVPNALKAGPFGSALTKSMYVPSGYKVYGQEQVISGDHATGNYYVNEAKYQQLSSCSVAEGDLLISMMGTVGRALVLPHGCEPGIINPRLIKATVSARMHVPFVTLWLSAPLFRRPMMELARGVAMDGLNLKILRSLPFPVPPFGEQKTIVGRVSSLLRVCDDLEAKLDEHRDQGQRLMHAVVGSLVA